MTKQRTRRLRDKLAAARSRILLQYPAFGMLLMYFRFVATPAIRRATVDYQTIYLSPDLLDKLHARELDYLLCHLLMHVLRGDIDRPEEWWGDDYHLACNLQIDDTFEIHGVLREEYPHLGKRQRIPPGSQLLSIRGMTLEQILEKFVFSLYDLPDHVRFQYLCDTDEAWNGGSVPLEGQTLLIDIPEMLRKISGKGGGDGEGDEDGENTADREGGTPAQSWRDRAAAAAATAKLQMSDEPQRMSDDVALLEELPLGQGKASRLDWRRLLQEFLQEAVSDYSFSPPDRRFAETDFFLPDLNEKDLEVKNIYFMVDSSGSVDTDQLATVYGEIAAAIVQFNGRLQAWLSFFDVQVTEPVSFSRVADIRGIIPRGGGGTSFVAMLEAVRARQDIRPDCLIVFTDGFADFPTEDAADGIPTLWILDNDEVMPPWGRVIHIL